MMDGNDALVMARRRRGRTRVMEHNCGSTTTGDDGAGRSEAVPDRPTPVMEMTYMENGALPRKDHVCFQDWCEEGNFFVFE